MELSKREIAQLRKLVVACEKILAKADVAGRSAGAAKKDQKPKRIRRSGKELIAFRRMLKAERKRGVSGTELAKKHGVSTTYIYTL
jgi:hypothetical protein